MSAYFGKSENCRVRIIATTGWLKEYAGQECEATFYEPGMSVHINSEQLKPPLPKMQSAKETDVERLK